MLRHYILKHKDEIRNDELEWGIRIRRRFRTAMERQVAEAVIIAREKEAGTVLLNSKAEYNCCKAQRLETIRTKMNWIEEQIEIENEKKIQESFAEMRKCKKKKKKEKLCKESHNERRDYIE